MTDSTLGNTRNRPLKADNSNPQVVGSPAAPSTTLRGAAIPIVFGQCVGHYQPPSTEGPSRDLAILFASPWGFEEICVRRLWRIMAERLSDLGIASLRFDYPGTGDAPPVAQDPLEPGDWRTALVGASQELSRLSGTGRTLVVGHGIGASLAYSCQKNLHDLVAIALLAPVSDGRTYLRELSMLAKIEEPKLAQAPPGEIAFDGAVVPQKIVNGIKRIKLSQAEAADPHLAVFLARRSNRAADNDLAERLERQHPSILMDPYDEFGALVSNITLQKMPEGLIDTLTDWVNVQAGTGRAPRSNTVIHPSLAVSKQHNAIEEHVRFGQNQNLSGTICKPKTPNTATTCIVLLNTSNERAAGRGSSVAALARELASEGYMSLRFDTAGIADSPPTPGAKDLVIYSQGQVDDVGDALSLMRQHGAQRFILLGRCSGGYLAFRAAIKNQDIVGAVMANPYTLEWDESRNLEEELRFVPVAVDSYRGKILSRQHWEKVFKGDVNLWPAVMSIGLMAKNRLERALKPLTQRLRTPSHATRQLHVSLDALVKRNVALSFLFSPGDPGLAYFQRHFDVKDSRLPKFPSVEFDVIDCADHNMLSVPGRQRIKSDIMAMLKVQPATRAGD